MATETAIQKALYATHIAHERLEEALAASDLVTREPLQAALAAASEAALALELRRAEPIKKMTWARQDGDSPWIQGGFLESGFKYRFEAKVFDVGSEYGIRGGRISHLHITEGRREVACYDRGWGTSGPPCNWRFQQALAALIIALESLPTSQA